MTPERWQKVSDLFHSALRHTPDQRAAFLDQVCNGDLELRREIESLITFHNNSDSVVDAYPFEAAARLLGEDEPDLSVGQRIGQYKILSLLGRGGMGEVYLAYDGKLGRKIALKLLPANFTHDRERVQRFEQEARAASALNHPNILTIFDIEKIESTHFIATEYIEGQTLRQRMVSGKMELGAALDVATQVASALSAAHQTGIAHRDIKPENIMMRPDGYAKVLDFGLAKLSERNVASIDTESQAFAAVKTDTGEVIGTTSYMSPEQARGKNVDQRSDVFSFGAVFVEMLTGRKAFRGDSDVDTLHSIIHEEPAGLSGLRSKVPTAVYRVLRRCLEKEPEHRYQNGAELLAALKQCSSAAVSGSRWAILSGSFQISRRIYGITHPNKKYLNLFLLFLTLILVGASVWLLLPRNASKSVLPPMKVIPFTSLPGREWEPAISPDGTKIAYCWSGDKDNVNGGIYVKQIEAGNPLRLTTHPWGERSPVWSPDGNYIAFSRFLETDGSDGGIYIIPSLGGAERKVYSTKWGDAFTGFCYIDWSPDGKLLVFQERGSKGEPYSIYLLTIDTLEKRKLTTPPEQHWSGDKHPVFSPDSQTLAFLRDTSIASDDIYIVPLSGGEPRRVTFDNTPVPGLAWTPDGAHIVFTSRRGGTADLRLWMLSVSGGAPEPITAGGEKGSDVAISRQGNRLAYTVASTSGDTDIWRLELSGSTGQASSQGKFITSTREDSSPQYSPDGKRITFSSDRSGSDEIWVCDSDGSNLIQLTQFGGPSGGSPHWSPDGRQIAFDSRLEGPSQIFLIDAEGGRPRRITNGEADETAPSWSVDGKWIYFLSNRSGEQQVMKVPVQGGDAVAVTGRAGYWASESPDAKFLYYDIENHGVWSIVRVPINGGREEPVVTKGYEMFNWAVLKDGIYFINSDAQARKIEFYSFATGRTKQIAMIGNQGFPGFSVSPDGRSILYTEVEGSYSTDIMLVENFR